jgi:hypothetical protein
MGRGGQESLCNAANAKTRLAVARQYQSLAELASADTSAAAQTAGVGNAVLAGIAAADAICCVRLGKRSSSTNHQDAVRLLQQVDQALAQSLAVLVAVKTPSQYGESLLSPALVTKSMRALDVLIIAAERIVASG